MDRDQIPSPIGKTLGIILGIGSLLLLPVAVFVTFAYLHTNHLTARGVQVLISIVWGMLNVLLLGPVLIIGLIPAFGRFAYGPPRFRKQWLSLQLAAWIGTLIFGATGLAYWLGTRKRPMIDACTFHAIPTAAAAFGLYLCVMSFMPATFFDEDRMGQNVKKFLGVQSTKSVPLACFGAAIAMAAIAALMWWVPASTFAN